MISSGDIVKYIPLLRVTQSEPQDSCYGLKSGHVYRVYSVSDMGYVSFFKGDAGSHYSNFKKLDPSCAVQVEEVVPYPSAGDRVDRLKIEYPIGSTVAFNPKPIDKIILAELHFNRLEEGCFYTVSGHDKLGLGIYLKEVSGGFGDAEDNGFPVGFFDLVD